MQANKEVIHLMGICGTAMASLAGLFQEMGYEVRGSDQNVYPPMSTKLESLGIKIMEGYRPENLSNRPDKVIVGNVITRSNPEAQYLLESGIPYMSLPQAMGQYIIGNRHSVVIAGTHGKTTTTAMCAWVCDRSGLNPGFMIGGVPLNFQNSFSLGKGKHFVIEGDEYDTAFFDKVPKFIYYHPRSVILTGVEFDHADIYKNLEDVKNAFRKLLRLIPQDGHLIYNADDENVASLLEETQCRKIQGYGIKNGDWKLGDVRWGEKTSQFDVLFRDKKIDTVETQLFGEYNLLNSLSVYAMASQLGIERQLISQSLASFRNVKRRQEIIGEPRGITVIEDFAHHPTAVRVTIDGIRKRYRKSKIIAVFEPRSATSRRSVFQHDYATALAQADEVIVSEPYDQSNITEDQRLSAKALADEVSHLKPQLPARACNSVDEIISLLKQDAQPGNVILIMSNGAFGGIYQKLLAQL